MRTIIDVPESTLEDLGIVGRHRHASRASLIRQAIAEFLERNRKADSGKAFGIWHDRHRDGLSHQRTLRGEWPR